jgi:DNA-binding protein YbaB
MKVRVEFLNLQSQRGYGVYTVVLNNSGSSIGVAINPSASSYYDAFKMVQLEVSGAVNTAISYMTGSRLQRRGALEQYLSEASFLPSGSF